MYVCTVLYYSIVCMIDHVDVIENTSNESRLTAHYSNNIIIMQITIIQTSQSGGDGFYMSRIE
jgi:hypothetical protein